MHLKTKNKKVSFVACKHFKTTCNADISFQNNFFNSFFCFAYWELVSHKTILQYHFLLFVYINVKIYSLKNTIQSTLAKTFTPGSWKSAFLLKRTHFLYTNFNLKIYFSLQKNFLLFYRKQMALKTYKFCFYFIFVIEVMNMANISNLTH